MATDVKPRSNRLLMVLGLVIAAVAFIAVVVFAGNRGSSGGPSTTQKVVVTAVDVPAGTQISPQLVKTVDAAAEVVPAGAYGTITCAPKGGGCTDVDGQFAAVALPKNTVLTQSNLVSSTAKLPPTLKPYLDIPAGQVAVTIPAGGELQAVGGFIQPDDRVDVLASGLPGQKQGTWKAVYQNIVIKHVGPVGSANTQGISSSYILFVPLDQAENLSYLFASGTYKFVLKSQKDATPTDTLGPANTSGASQDTFNSKFAIPK
jgi:Flp pilus assembly protein CpaB